MRKVESKKVAAGERFDFFSTLFQENRNRDCCRSRPFIIPPIWWPIPFYCREMNIFLIHYNDMQLKACPTSDI